MALKRLSTGERVVRTSKQAYCPWWLIRLTQTHVCTPYSTTPPTNNATTTTTTIKRLRIRADVPCMRVFARTIRNRTCKFTNACPGTSWTTRTMELLAIVGCCYGHFCRAVMPELEFGTEVLSCVMTAAQTSNWKEFHRWLSAEVGSNAQEDRENSEWEI